MKITVNSNYRQNYYICLIKVYLCTVKQAIISFHYFVVVSLRVNIIPNTMTIREVMMSKDRLWSGISIQVHPLIKIIKKKNIKKSTELAWLY